MRSRTVVTLIAFLSTLGCIEETPSLQPLFTSSETVAGIEGDWVSADSDDRFRLEAGPDGYDLSVVGVEMISNGKKEPLDLMARMRFGRRSGRLLADITAAEGNGAFDGSAMLGLWPVHVFARVTVSPGRLEIAQLDQAWLHKAITTGRIFLAHEVVGEDLVLTAPTEELQRVIGDWAFEDEAFDSPIVLVRPRR